MALGTIGSMHNPIIRVHPVFNASVTQAGSGTDSGVVTTTSVEIPLRQMRNLKATAVGVRGNANFTIKLQGSIDNSNFIDISANFGGATVAKIDDVVLLPYVRVHITNGDSGSQTGTVVVDLIA